MEQLNILQRSRYFEIVLVILIFLGGIIAVFGCAQVATALDYSIEKKSESKIFKEVKEPIFEIPAVEESISEDTQCENVDYDVVVQDNEYYCEDEQYDDSYDYNVYYNNAYYDESVYSNNSSLTPQSGVNYHDGRRETYYSSNVLYHHNTSNWNLDENGYYRTDEGYYVVAASDMDQGTIFEGSQGTCIVLDTGCAAGTTDYYVAW